MKPTLLLIFLSVVNVLFAQNVAVSGNQTTSTQTEEKYSRISISYLLLDVGSGQFYNVARNAFLRPEVPDKFDYNSLNNPYIKSPLTRSEIDNNAITNPNVPYFVTSKVMEALSQGHFANEILSKWFSRKADGSFGVDLLQQRGLYNATDDAVLTAQASERGMARIKDSGEKLINNTYIMVYDISDLITMDEYYDRLQKNSKTPIERDKDGFYSLVTSYVFKINFNDSISSYFWQNLWANSGDPDLPTKREAFDKFEIPLSFVTKVSGDVFSIQNKPGSSAVMNARLKTSQELLASLVKIAINQSLTFLENTQNAFQVKTQLLKADPLIAKIGKKEGLRIDQKYFVFEKVQGSTNQIVEKNKGSIRAKRVVDNRQVSSGQTQPSQFYQVSGGKLDEGMIIKQHHDLGTSISLGCSFGGVKGFEYRIEIRISRIIPVPMLKIFVEGGSENASYYFQGLNRTYENFTRYGGGIGKEFCFLRNFKFQPYFGFGFEQLTDSQNKDAYLNSWYAHPGFCLGFNLKHNIQFIWNCGSYIMNNSMRDETQNTISIDGIEQWGKIWGRGGLANSIGLRYEL